jgi:signal transduction histidine kinase
MLSDRSTRSAELEATFRHRTHPAAIGEVRHEVCDLLGDAVAPETLAQATLLVSELATNAVRHSGSPWFAVRVVLDGHLRVEVLDGGPGFAGDPAPDFDRGGGYGLQLVDTVADAWGAEDGDAPRVWFTLAA